MEAIRLAHHDMQTIEHSSGERCCINPELEATLPVISIKKCLYDSTCGSYFRQNRQFSVTAEEQQCTWEEDIGVRKGA